MEACQTPSLANSAFTATAAAVLPFPVPLSDLRKSLQDAWGNIDYGIKELSQDNGKSEMQAYAWDLETNTISVQNFTNPHIRETKTGSVQLTSQRDIYELNANMGARRLRSRILAILPADLVEDAIKKCKETIAGKVRRTAC